VLLAQVEMTGYEIASGQGLRHDGAVPTPTPPLPAAGLPLDPGSLAEWVAAVGALLAVAAAAVSLVLSYRAVRLSAQANMITADAYEADVKERREAQARFVYALGNTRIIHAGQVEKVGARWRATVRRR
jgi:hypothetical protein